jgi:hypothetical protein
MSFFGRVMLSIGRRLAVSPGGGRSQPVETSPVALLDRSSLVESLGRGGLIFPPTPVSAPAIFVFQQAETLESEPMLTPQLEGEGPANRVVITVEKRPHRGGFRPIGNPAEVDGFSLEAPDELPVRWRLLLPALQVSVDRAWSNELDFPEGCQPYNYQWEGIKALAGSEGFLLADDMGTGKTIQALVAARILFQKGLVKSMLVVAPISILANWKREAAGWAGILMVDLVRGSPDSRKALWLKPAHVKLTAYETLRQDQDWLAQKGVLDFDLVVLDEAQRIKNAGTATAQAVKRVEAARRWGLSGTPLENRLEEVRAICSYIRPDLFKNAKLSPQRVRALLKPHLLRRRKDEVLKDLPPKEEFNIWLKMGDEQQKAYDEMEKERVL